MHECQHSRLLWFRFGLPRAAGTQHFSEALEDAMELNAMSLRPLIRKVLQQLIEQGSHPSLTPTVCETLLQDVPSTGVKPVQEEGGGEEEGGKKEGGEQEDKAVCGPSTGLVVLMGYPDYPLYERLADSLACWMITGKCPVEDLPVMYLLNEQDTLDERQRRMESVWSELSEAYGLWSDWSQDEKTSNIDKALKLLGLRGVLDLVGVRKTVGSSDILPPPKELLLQTFNTPHSTSAKLTAGARALAKHCHRDDSLQWWGKCSGNDADKNAHAFEVVSRIMREATWINIHSLPHDVKVVEMRTMEGYGARWLLDGTEFRGFLEPQMEGGHELKWRH